jgi:hypothetical protein
MAPLMLLLLLVLIHVEYINEDVAFFFVACQSQSPSLLKERNHRVQTTFEFERRVDMKGG